MNDTAPFRDALRAVIQGRPWVVAVDVLAGATRTVDELLALGASRVMAVGAYRGMGPLPDPARVPTVLLDLPPADMMAAIRAADDALSDLPAEVRAAVDRFDPAREARVVGTLFSSGRPVADRPVWGARPAAWQRLEDKTVVDALWDEAGVDRAPSAVVPATHDALAAAAEALDRGGGTVWAADNKHGFHGGAKGLRWVRDPRGAEGEAAARFLEGCADRARVMPFVEGVPCSIHGWVFDAPFADDGATTRTAAFRPCEMVVMRAPSEGRFVYAQAATFWDPPPADRAAMRALARRVGDHLHATVGYRGVFTVDGVMGAGGFVPTELNPRFGAALMVLGRALPDLPLYLLHLATAAGEHLDLDPLALERLVVQSADANRQGGCARVIETRVGADRTGRLYETAGGYEVLDAGADAPRGWAAVGAVRAGPHATGGFVDVRFDAAHAPAGPPVAPRAVAALRAIERSWGLAMGEMEAAVDVRGV
ncbi:MAG: hypothetical protein U0324_39365 [Polyangiales bacterium]